MFNQHLVTQIVHHKQQAGRSQILEAVRNAQNKGRYLRTNFNVLCNFPPFTGAFGVVINNGYNPIIL